MKKFNLFLKSIFDWAHRVVPNDKTLHVIAGAIIAVVFTVIFVLIIRWNGFSTGMFFLPYFSIPISVLAVVLFLGFVKEAWDALTGYGVADMNDVWATVKGGFIAAIILWACIWIFGLVPPDVKLPSNRERMEQIHRNDTIQYQNLKNRSDSLLNILK